MINQADIRDAYTEYSVKGPMRAVDIAKKIGISEGQLLAAHVKGNDRLTSIPLTRQWDALWHGLSGLGELLALSRHALCVHEKKTRYAEILKLNQYYSCQSYEFNLHIDGTQFAQAFYVEEQNARGRKNSIQWFDRQGVALHKTYSTQGDIDLGLQRMAKQYQINEQDTHRFLMSEHAQAPSTCTNNKPTESSPRPIQDFLEQIAEAGLNIRLSVSNQGVIQQHQGKIKKISLMWPWLNILDPTFNLHLRVDETYRLVLDRYRVTLQLNGSDVLNISLLDESSQDDLIWNTLYSQLAAGLHR